MQDANYGDKKKTEEKKKRMKDESLQEYIPR